MKLLERVGLQDRAAGLSESAFRRAEAAYCDSQGALYETGCDAV